MGYNNNLKTAKISPAHKKFSFFKKIIVVVVALAVIGCGLFLYFKIYHQQTDTNTVQQIPSADNFDTRLTTVEEASQIATNGNYAAGQKVLDDDFAGKTDETSTVDYYVDKAILAVNNKYYDEALGFAKQANDIAKSRLTSRILAQIAEAKGDKAKAIEYYQLTISRYSENDKLSDDQALNYSEDLQKLQELQR